MKKYSITTVILLGLGLNNGVYSAKGLLFNVTTRGTILTINTTVPNHTYPSAGIKINSPGFTLNSGCTPAANGYCLYSVSDIKAATITILGTVGPIDFTLCLNGKAALSCQNFSSVIRPLITVGTYRNNNGLYNLLSYISNNGGNSWILSNPLPSPSDIFRLNPGTNSLNSVSCNTTSLLCSTVGSYTKGTGVNNATSNGEAPLSYTSTDGGHSWSLNSPLPLPADVLTSNLTASILGSVNCNNSSLLCTAVGSYKQGTGFNNATPNGTAPLSYTSINGGYSWILSNPLPLPNDLRNLSTKAFFPISVTCDSSGLLCTAVGRYQRGTGPGNATPNGTAPLSYTSSNGGNSWVLSSPLPLPADVLTSPAAVTFLNGVSCDSSGLLCTSVGRYIKTTGGVAPLSYHSSNGGNSWLLSSPLPLPADVLTTASALTRLIGVSCKNSGLECTAVGSYTKATGDNFPLSYTSINGGNSWSLSSPLPLPANVQTPVLDLPTLLTGITCDSSGLLCSTVGQYRYIGSIDPDNLSFSYTSIDGGNNWSLSSPFPIPSDSDSSPDMAVFAVH